MASSAGVAGTPFTLANAATPTFSEHAQPHPCTEHALGFQESSAPGLLLADMHCLPGMEGGPVLSSSGKLIGVLSLPLSSPSFSAEA